MIVGRAASALAHRSPASDAAALPPNARLCRPVTDALTRFASSSSEGGARTAAVARASAGLPEFFTRAAATGLAVVLASGA
eukprot:scaffold74485_cov18-Phaeocystis_antarctica.AAC.1